MKYIKQAGLIFKEKHDVMISATLVAALVGAYSALSNPISRPEFDIIGLVLEGIQMYLETNSTNVTPILEGVLRITGMGIAIYGIITCFLSGPAKMGVCRFNQKLYRSDDAEISDIFSHFKNFFKGFFADIAVGIINLLGTLLLLIPGMFFAYSYSMTFYILNDDPTISVKQAMSTSKKIMKGHKWQLFCIHIFFAGILLIFLLIAFIAPISFPLFVAGLFSIAPLIEQAECILYNDIVGSIDDEYLQTIYIPGL